MSILYQCFYERYHEIRDEKINNTVIISTNSYLQDVQNNPDVMKDNITVRVVIHLTFHIR